MKKLIQSIPHIDIYHAASGDETLGLLIYNQFALILLDVNMPGMDGYEVARLISSTAAHKHTPIVMLTAHDPSCKNILKAYEAGAVDYLTKPIEPTILLNKVKQFVNLNQLQVKADTLRAERELILEIAGQGVIKLANNGSIQFVNSKCSLLINKTAHELLNSHFNTWFKSNKNHAKSSNDLFGYICRTKYEDNVEGTKSSLFLC